MSKHLERSSRKRATVLGAAVLVAGSVATATVALGANESTSDGSAAGTTADTRTYACAGSALAVARSSSSAVRLSCSSGVTQVGRARTFAGTGTTGSTALPRASAPGNLLVTTVLTPATSTVALDGWTKAYDAASGQDGLRLQAWYRTASASDSSATATVSPAARVSMITAAFAGARAAAPIGSAAAAAGATAPVPSTDADGVRWLSALGVRGHLRSGGRVVVNGDTRLAQIVTSSVKDAASPARASRSASAAVAGALSVVPGTPAAVPAGAVSVPVGGTTTADCGGAPATFARVSPTVVTVTCTRSEPAPTTTSTTTTTTEPTTTTTPPTTTTTTEPTTTTTPPTTTTTKPPTTTTTTTPTSPPAPAPAGKVCTSPAFTTSNSNGGWSEGGYYVHNNMWNIGKYPSLRETLEACSHASWNVTATADNSSGNGEVKTYPNVHKDFSAPAWSSFKSMTSTFAAKGPGVGIYNIAYDIWMNGVPGNREIMIWTENHNQRPAGDIVGSLSVSGITWDVWATSDNGYLAFTPKSSIASGNLDIKAFIDYLVAQGRVPANSTLGQVCFGVEIVSTDGKPATFNFTDFSLSSS
jgi:hypothetical protein